MKNRSLYLVTGFTILLVVGYIYIKSSKSEPTTTTTAKQDLIPIESITHGHGLSVDIKNPNNVYIATHHGLLLLKNGKDLYQVGNKKDDYMGFSPHPKDPKIFFSSGHPESGGNIGFQKSLDGGFSWETVSDGVDGPVDFHAMAVSPANPDLIFGWFHGAIQRSTDGGKNWEIVSRTSVPVVNLAADPKNENIVYASSPQGLLVSSNKGKDWNMLLEGFVSTVAVNPQDSQKLITYSEKLQLAKSNDSGKSWKKIPVDFSGETPLFIAFYHQNPEIVYLLTEKNSIYESIDGGTLWNKIR